MAESAAAAAFIKAAGTATLKGAFIKVGIYAAVAVGSAAYASRQQKQAKAKASAFREQELRPIFDPRAPMMAVFGTTRVAGVYEYFNVVNNRDSGVEARSDVHDVVYRLAHCYSPNETGIAKAFWLADSRYDFPSDFTALAGPQEGEFHFNYMARRPVERSSGINYGGRGNEKHSGWTTYMQEGYGASAATMIRDEAGQSGAFYHLPVAADANAKGIYTSSWRFRNTQGNLKTLASNGGFVPVSVLFEEKHYDPRKDSSRTLSRDGFVGNGTQRLNDPTTWEPSSNPIVQYLNYKLFFQTRPLAEARIDYKDLIIPAMNICDGSAPIPNPMTGGVISTVTEKRYTCNVALYLADVSDRANIKTILATCSVSYTHLTLPTILLV